ncbi:MAG: galactokinase [Lentisphaeria bacterium]|nr:galactokinase [Lentisphaeria bacterium]
MSSLTERFQAHFGHPATVLAEAPGRLEILGNHTDYNEGFVLSCAVRQKVRVVLAPSGGDLCRLKDFRNGSEKTFLRSEAGHAIRHDWSNYVKGVIVELEKRGFTIGGFDAALLSDVPLSAGMSSSAALETAFGLAIGAAFHVDLPKEEWARVGQGVENSYLGLQTGLLDQFSSLFGQEGALILSDFRSVEVLRTVALPAGYGIVVVNSMVKHNLVDSEYNTRRADCRSAAEKLAGRYPGAVTLRDISPEQLEAARDCLTEQEYLRAAHVVGECDRVMRGVAALDAGDAVAFGQLLYESHESSRKHFANSSPEQDALIELGRQTAGGIGARLSGGGFGGITVHLVQTEKMEDYGRAVAAGFEKQYGVVPEVIFSAPGAGASVCMLTEKE